MSGLETGDVCLCGSGVGGRWGGGVWERIGAIEGGTWCGWRGDESDFLLDVSRGGMVGIYTAVCGLAGAATTRVVIRARLF